MDGIKIDDVSINMFKLEHVCQRSKSSLTGGCLHMRIHFIRNVWEQKLNIS